MESQPTETVEAEQATTDRVSPETGRPFTREQVVRFSAGFLVLGLFWTIGLSIISSVLLPQRLKDIGVGSPETLLGTINAVTAVVSLVSNLVFGNLSDRSRSPLGRRGPWVVTGAIISGTMYFLVGVLGTPVLITLVYSLAMVGLNMMLAPGIAVLSDRVPLLMRGTMSSFYGVGVTVGYPVGALIGGRFISTPFPGFVLSGVIAVLSGVLAFIMWPRESSAKQLPRTDGGSLGDLVKSFRPPRNAPDFYKAFVGRLFMLISYQMIYAYQLYILQNYIGQSTEQSGATIGTMSVIALVVALIGSAVSGPVSDRLGRRKVPIIAASVLFAVGIAMPWIMPTTTGMLLFAGIAGLGYAVYTAVDQALNVDVLPNKEQAGKDLGILNLGTTLGQMAGPLITSAIVVATGAYQFIFPVSIACAVIGAILIGLIKGVK